MSEADLRAKCHDFGCDAPALHKRLDALEAELAGWKLFADELVPFDPNNESEIKAAATAISKQFHELKTETERLRAELVTAHNDALEKAAQVCDKLAQNIYDEYGSTDQETGERMVPTRFMDTVEADEECAACIRALKDKP